MLRNLKAFLEYADKKQNATVGLTTAIPVFHNNGSREDIPLIDLLFKDPALFYKRYKNLKSVAPQDPRVKYHFENMLSFLHTVGQATQSQRPWLQTYAGHIDDLIRDTHDFTPNTTIPNTPLAALEHLADNLDFRMYVSIAKERLGLPKRYDQKKYLEKIIALAFPPYPVPPKAQPKPSPQGELGF